MLQDLNGSWAGAGLMMMPPRLPLLNELYMTAAALGRKLQLHLRFLQAEKNPGKSKDFQTEEMFKM